jgi:hypothetical protein
MSITAAGGFVEAASAIIDHIEISAAACYDADIASIDRRFADLKVLVDGHTASLAAEDVEGDPAFASLAERSRSLYGRFYCHAEAAASLATLAAGGTGELAFSSNNDALAVEEMRAAGVGPDSHLGFAGCGSFPWSVVRYQRLTGCRITCIDSNPLAIHLAHETLRALGLRLSVDLLEADARDVDYGRFSHVVVAAMAAPKDRICARVRATAPPSARMIVRTALGLNCMFYEAYRPEPEEEQAGRFIAGPADGGELASWVLAIER